MDHIKEPLLLIGKSSPCGGSGFPLTIRVVLYHMSLSMDPEGPAKPVIISRLHKEVMSVKQV